MTFKSGNIPWNKGKKDVQIPWNKGRPWSLEVRKKLSIARNRKYYYTGHPIPQEQRESLSRARKGIPLRERLGIEKATKVREAWIKIGRNRIGHPRPDVISRNKDPEFTKYRLRNWVCPKNFGGVHPRKSSPTSLEQKLITVIKDNKLVYDFVGNGQITIGRLNPDFINTDGKKILIEIYGEPWHTDQVWPLRRNSVANPKVREIIYGRYGFRTLSFWGEELRKIKSQEIVSRILAFEKEN